MHNRLSFWSRLLGKLLPWAKGGESAVLLRVTGVIIIFLGLLGVMFLALPEERPAQAAPKARPAVEIISNSLVVIHTINPGMSVFNNGTVTDRFFVDNGDDQIRRVGTTTLAIRFGNHSISNIDVGVQDEFEPVRPITLNTVSVVPGFSQDSYAVYRSTNPATPYEIKQRTLVEVGNNCAIMELVIENTGSTSLLNGRLLYMLDIDAGREVRGDRGGFDPVRQVVYQTDYNGTATDGYAMGIALLEGELRGYGILTDTASNFPDPTPSSGSDVNLSLQLDTPLYLPNNVITVAEASDNLVSWLVADINTLDSGQTETLVFGLCAASVDGQDEVSTETLAKNTMLGRFDQIELVDPPAVNFSKANYQVGEPEGQALITATLSYPFRHPISVGYETVAGGTATPNEDYISKAGTLSFPPLVTTRTFTIEIISDTINEPDETVFLSLTDPDNASLGAINSAILKIIDDDNKPNLSINDVTVTEGEQTIFTVTLSPASGKTVTVKYGTINDTAIAGQDYTGSSGTLTFTPGTTAQSVTVSTINDNLDEGNEKFLVKLSEPVNAEIGKGQGKGTIIDNDSEPDISISDALPVIEGNTGDQTPAVFTVTLSAVSGREVRVRYSTADGAAEAGKDYIALSNQLLTFPPGTTVRTLSVTVLGDDEDEWDESFFVDLHEPVNAQRGKTPGKGGIIDNDPTMGYLPFILKGLVCSPIDTFTSQVGSLNKWPEEKGENGFIMDYDGQGQYRIRTKDVDERLQYTAPLQNIIFQEYYYSIEAEIQWKGNKAEGYGLIFAFVPSDDGKSTKQSYRFLVDNTKGKYQLDRRHPASTNSEPFWDPVITSHTSQFIMIGIEDKNVLKVAQFNNTIHLYINGHYITSTINSLPLKPVQVGLGVLAEAHQVGDARFDNFVYCYQDPQTIQNLKLQSEWKSQNSSYIDFGN